MKREIQALNVQCRDCNWKGIFSESSAHFKDCRVSCLFCTEKMSRYDLDRHTESCEKFLLNFKHETSYAQQEVDEDKVILLRSDHTCEEYSSNFEHRLSYAKQDTRDTNEELSNLLAKLEHLSDILRKLETNLEILCSRITELQKQIHPIQNSDAEERDLFLFIPIENASYDGSYLWKIPQFSQRKADAQNGKYTSIFSQPFYSGRYGYKMCLRLYIMGDGIETGTHFSLFFVVMHGEFDNILQWPFTHKVTFKLINHAGGRDIVYTFQPDPRSRSFRKPKSDMNVASGCPQFVSHTDLKKGGFIKNDTIFIKVMIDTTTIFHP